MTIIATQFYRKLENFAKLAINVGVNLQSGQPLLIRAPIGAAKFVNLLAQHAYQAGAPLVHVIWDDENLTLSRFAHAPRNSFTAYPQWQVQAYQEVIDQGGCLVTIVAQNPDLLAGQDPALVALSKKTDNEHRLGIRQQAMKNEFPWTLLAIPVPTWANKVYPDHDQPIDALWEMIFEVCRVNQPDPVAAWQAHIERMGRVKGRLNERRYQALTYRGPGIDFRLGLPEGHIWHGVEAHTPSGQQFIPNLPTEEVFTLPHAAQAEGVVRSSKPLSYSGVLIDEFTLRFEAGRVVNCSARTGAATLQRLVDSDEGAGRLGEVALVPASSPISQSGVLFYHTLFDENAASHLAIGRGYRFCLEGGEAMSDDEFAEAGGNVSLVHVDFMIGSAQLDVDGVRADGEIEPVMRQGEWV